MIIRRGEAIDLCRKWSAGGATVYCQCDFPVFAFGLNGRICVSPDGSKLRIMSDEDRAEIVVRLLPEMEFVYEDSRIVTGVADESESCLVICLVIFIGGVPEDAPDTITITARE